MARNNNFINLKEGLSAKKHSPTRVTMKKQSSKQQLLAGLPTSEPQKLTGKTISQSRSSSGNQIPNEGGIEKLPLAPKALNYQFSELAYFSTQSASSSDISSGVSTGRSSQPNSGSGSGSGPSNGSLYSQLGQAKVQTRLFKGMSLCPPLIPKTMISPNLDENKQPSHSSFKSGSASRSKKRKTSSTSSQKQAVLYTPVQQPPFKYYNATMNVSQFTSPVRRQQDLVNPTSKLKGSESAPKLKSLSKEGNKGCPTKTYKPQQSFAMTSTTSQLFGTTPKPTHILPKSVYQSPVKGKVMRKSNSEHRIEQPFGTRSEGRNSLQSIAVQQSTRNNKLPTIYSSN